MTGALYPPPFNTFYKTYLPKAKAQQQHLRGCGRKGRTILLEFHKVSYHNLAPANIPTLSESGLTIPVIRNPLPFSVLLPFGKKER